MGEYWGFEEGSEDVEEDIREEVDERAEKEISEGGEPSKELPE